MVDYKVSEGNASGF
ncbi:Protein of unknown function [Escherichia coli]|nr:Protein of unknown function [Escherichia coli D6-113.11]CDP71122.1 Protein of unknown function [Escherichia coli]CDU36504.1 Protein of unknown function [Escherichia coli D6-113.11]CDU38313.1 Protein of unknown function [Escherichia coli]